MGDDLVKRLRSVLGYKDLGICPEAADRIEELEAELDALKAKPAWSAALQDLFDLGSDYQVDCATKEEWAQRAFNAEAKLAWQPIETAPKDGTEIIVGASLPWHGWRCDMVAWDKNRTMWWDNNGLPYQPTHWMSLPAPPSQN